MLNSSARRPVTSVDFYKTPSSSTIIHLNGCCSLFNVVRIKRMILIGDCLDVLGEIHIIIVLTYTTVIIEVKPLTEITF